MGARISRRAALKTGASLAAGALGGAAGFEILRRRRPHNNVIWIVSDAMRGDSIGRKRLIGGAMRSITPNIDTLAEEGVSFDRAVSPSSWTRTSVGSFLWGVSPTRVAVTPAATDLTIHDPKPSIPRRLVDAGHRATFVNASWILDMPSIESQFHQTLRVGNRKEKMWASEGDSMYYRSAHSAIKLMRKAIRDQAETGSFFIYAHLMDTHEPYYCPEGMLALLGGSFNPKIAPWKLHKIVALGETHDIDGLSLDEAFEQLRLHYDASVMVVDGFVANLLHILKENGMLNDTTIILTADHGEEFADNVEESPAVTHAYNLSQPEIHVPLVAWKHGGGLSHGKIEAPFAMTDAIEQLTLWQGGVADEPAFLSGGAPGACTSLLRIEDRYDGFAYIQGDTKISGRFQDGRAAGVKAFRLRGAPEPVELPAAADAVVAKMERDIAAYAGTMLRPSDASDEQKRALEALGYLN